LPPAIIVPTAIPMVAFTGPGDTYLRIFETTFPHVKITVRGNEIFLSGDLEQSEKCEALMKELLVLLRAGQNLSADTIHQSVAMIKHVPADHPAEVLSLNILSNRGKTIRPKTANQNVMLKRSMRTLLLLVLAQQEQVRLILQWPRQSKRYKRKK